MNSDELDKVIDDYLLERLAPSERTAFEVRLGEDSALRQRVQLRRTMIDQLRVIGQLDMKERILRIQDRVEKTAKPKNRSRRIFFIAIILLIVSILSFFLFRSKPAPQPDYFATYYAAYPLPFGTRATETNQALYEAGRAYQTGAYARAIPLLEKVQATGASEDDRITLALAISHLELSDFDEALKMLSPLRDDETFLYQEQAIWYSALIYLKQGQSAEAKPLLNKLITNFAGQYQDAAATLLKHLETE